MSTFSSRPILISDCLTDAALLECQGERVRASVFDLAGGFDPDLEAFPGSFGENARSRHGANVAVSPKLLVEEGIVEAGAGRVVGLAAEVDGVDARPIDRCQAHRARLTTGIHFAALQGKGSERLAGLADGVDLAVSSGIVGGGDAVRAFSDDLSVFDDHGGKWASGAGADVLRRQLDGSMHEGGIGIDRHLCLLS